MPGRASVSSSRSSSRPSFGSSSYSSRPSYSSSSYSPRPVPPRPIAPPPTPRTNGITLSKSSNSKPNPPPPAASTSTSTTYSSTSTTSSVPASTPASTSSSGGFFSNMMDGLSWGTGQSIAHNTVSRIFNWGGGPVHSSSVSTYPSSTYNPNTTSSSTSTNTKSCEELNKQFKECLELNGNSHLVCKNAFKAYESCLSASSASK